MKKKKKKKKKRIKKMNIKCVNISKKETQGDSFWETKLDYVTKCSKIKPPINIYIKPLAKLKIDALMEEYKDIEWLAYLIGKDNEIEDIFIPEQSITSTSVNNINCEEFNKLPIIGVIHSHHNMGHTFSKTDDDYINMNHNISICISHSGLSIRVRTKTQCGSYMTVDGSIQIKYDVEFNKNEWIKKVKKKIKEAKYVIVNNKNSYGLGWSGEWNKEKDTEVKDMTYTGLNIKDKISLSDINIEPDDQKELDSLIEEIDFEKEKSVEEEMRFINELTSDMGIDSD